MSFFVFLQLNEGTNYAQSIRSLNLSSSEETTAFDKYIYDLVIDNGSISPDILADIRKYYPANDSMAGGKFHTGDSLFDRAASWYTDEMYLGPRRLFFDKAATLQPLFGYHFTEFIPGNDPARGGQLKSCSITTIFEFSCSFSCVRAATLIRTRPYADRE